MFQFPCLMNKTVFVLAGEVSGDLHASGALVELLRDEPDVIVFGTGGQKLGALGADLLYTVDQLSVMGFGEVLRHAFFLRRVIRDLKRAIVDRKPSVALLVDYPAMNLIMAKFLHDQGVPVVYYISPKVWAWKEGRVRKMRRYIDRLLVIFDFEVEFFRRHGVQAEYVGNPVVEEVKAVSLPPRTEFLWSHGIEEGRPLVGLLPGSRKQELDRIFPAMLEAAEMLERSHGAVFLLGRASHVSKELFSRHAESAGVSMVECSAYDVMRYSDVAMVTSGTATLEALCFGVPMVVVYKTSRLNYFIGRMVVKLHSISLANIVTNGLFSTRQTVKELLQDEASPEAIGAEVARLLDDEAARGEMRASLLEAGGRLAASTPSPAVAAVLQEYLTR